jgi:hypothetical protein
LGGGNPDGSSVGLGQAATSDRRQICDTRKCDGDWMQVHADDVPRHSIDLLRYSTSLKPRPQIERIVDTISDWDKQARAGVVGT